MNNELYSNQECVLNPLNPLDKIEECKLLSTKRKEFYKYTYDSTNVIKNITNYSDKYDSVHEPIFSTIKQKQKYIFIKYLIY